MKISDYFYEQRERWLLWMPVFIAFGVGTYYSLRYEPGLWIGVSALLIVSLKVYSDFARQRNWLIFMPLLFFVIGFLGGQIRTHNIHAVMLDKKTYPIEVSGIVSDIDNLPKNQHRILLEQISYPDDTPNMPESARIKLRGSFLPNVGDKIKIKIILMPLSMPVMPNAFDFQRYAFFKGFYATGYSLGNGEVIEPRKEGYVFENLRRFLHDRIFLNIKDADKAAITVAMLDGEEKDISDATMDIFRKAGIAHLMAISGQQVAIVTGIFFFLIRYILAWFPCIALRFHTKKIAAFCSIICSIFYMLLIGDSVSAERSVIMTSIVMLAIILDRDPFTLRLAAVTAAAMLLFNPEILFGASFQLSFSAVVALIAFYESASEKVFGTFYSQPAWHEKLLQILMAAAVTTMVASIAVAPFSLYHFSNTPIITSLIANIVAVPLSSFITIPFAILASFLMPLHLEYIPLQICDYSIDIILDVAKEVASWPYGMLHVGAFPILNLVLITIGGLWLCIWQGWPRYLGVIPIIISAYLLPYTPTPDILIADRGALYAVRSDNGKLFISDARKQKFVKNAWIEHESNKSFGFWNDADSPIKCDDNLCSYIKNNKKIAFVKTKDAEQSACENYDMVIADIYIDTHKCKASILLDRGERKYKGSYAIYINDKDINIESVLSARGHRPWTIY